MKKWIFIFVLQSSCISMEMAKTSELNREEIKKVFVAHQEQISLCYESAASSKKDTGKMVFEFEVNDQGQVIYAQWNEERSTLRQRAIGDCIAGKMKTWVFPQAASTETAWVYYPVIFK